MTLQQIASMAVKNSHWEDMIGECEAQEEKAIQQASSCGGCQRQQAQPGSTGTQRNSWQLLWQDEPWICTAVSDPVSNVKTPPMAGQSCSNNANNAAAKFQVFPKFILSSLMESPGFEPVSVVFYRLCISIHPFSSAFPVQGCREGAGAYPSCQRVKGAPLQG